MRFHFSPDAFERDSFDWRTVVHLNLVCIVNFILELLPATPPRERVEGFSLDGISDPDSNPPDEIERLRAQLRPLQEVEATLAKGMAMGKHLRRRSGNITLELDQSDYESEPTDAVVKSDTRRRVLSKLFKFFKVSSKSGESDERDEINEAREVISACCTDITSLWGNGAVRSIVSKHGELKNQATTL